MEFQVFDKATHKGHITTNAVVNLYKSGYCSLNVASKNLMKVKPGEKLRVLRSGKIWYMVHTKAATGYVLNNHGKNESCGVRFCSMDTVREILKSYNRPEGMKFYLQETDHTFEDYKVYELLPQPKTN
jgi:hypothetical protein